MNAHLLTDVNQTIVPAAHLMMLGNSFTLEWFTINASKTLHNYKLMLHLVVLCILKSKKWDKRSKHKRKHLNVLYWKVIDFTVYIIKRKRSKIQNWKQTKSLCFLYNIMSTNMLIGYGEFYGVSLNTSQHYVLFLDWR